MEIESAKSIQLELFDARESSPKQVFFSLTPAQASSPSLLDALQFLNIVKSRDDILFQKKGSVGVFSIPLGPDDPIYDGDRIELYRPILIDPKKVRRKKANQNKDAELKTKAKIRKERKELKDL
jgi:putative ubiquitin-RnfH superfamily antitoxin RatB of RatAB toxin-antitoxin module